MSSARKPVSPSRPRVNALSPLQTFSPLPQTTSPVSTPTTAAQAAASPLGINRPGGGYSRSNSASSFTSGTSAKVGGLSRSLSQHERVFTQTSRRESGAGGAAEADRGVTTRLILVKAPASDKGAPLRQRSKSSSNLPTAPMSASAPAARVPSPRTSRGPSFAVASFSSISPMSSIKSAGSPGGAGAGAARVPPARRPSIGVIETSRGEAGTRNKTLSPDEVLELARGLMSPVAAPEGPRPGGALRRSKSTGSTRRGSSASGVDGDKEDNTPEEEPHAELEPVDYVQMDANTLLPFSDRPRQVKDLLANAANTDLVELLQHAFPKTPLRADWKDRDVTTWSWEEMYAHLTIIDRAECADYEWVLLARTSVRENAVALWETLGTCLGCDSELITAGDEDETPAAWGGLGLGEEGEYDPSLSRVHVAGLETVDLEAVAAAAGETKSSAFNEEEEDREQFGTAGAWSKSMGGDTGDSPRSKRSSTLQDPILEEEQSPGGGRTHRLDPDPFSSPETWRGSMRRVSRDTSTSEDSVSVGPHSPCSPSDIKNGRSRSFVGLQMQIVADAPTVPLSPQAYSSNFSSSPLGLASPPAAFSRGMMSPQYERTPGNPLFVSSFNTLSLGPNLGRKASTGLDAPAVPMQTRGDLGDFRAAARRGLARKTSGAGLSDSALTFASESSVAAE